MQARDWRRDPHAAAGMKWMADPFTVTVNVGHPFSGEKYGFYSYLYALERLGVLYETDFFGRHD
jgi:hypothetical protein